MTTIPMLEKELEQAYKDLNYYKNRNEKLNNQLQQKENIIKEVREYITSHESIETIQQFDHNKNNKDLDYSTIDEMTRRYMMVHDKILEILDKEREQKVLYSEINNLKVRADEYIELFYSCNDVLVEEGLVGE